MSDDARHLERAIELAEQGRGTTRPNPLVGAVVVADGEVVGEGWHERPGLPHAEALALDQKVRSPKAHALGWTPTQSGIVHSVPRLVEEFRNSQRERNS